MENLDKYVWNHSIILLFIAEDWETETNYLVLVYGLKEDIFCGLPTYIA